MLHRHRVNRRQAEQLAGFSSSCRNRSCGKPCAPGCLTVPGSLHQQRWLCTPSSSADSIRVISRGLLHHAFWQQDMQLSLRQGVITIDIQYPSRTEGQKTGGRLPGCLHFAGRSPDRQVEQQHTQKCRATCVSHPRAPTLPGSSASGHTHTSADWVWTMPWTPEPSLRAWSANWQPARRVSLPAAEQPVLSAKT